MKLNNKGAAIIILPILLIAGMVATMFGVAIALDDKWNRKDRLLKIEPEDRLIRSGQYISP